MAAFGAAGPVIVDFTGALGLSFVDIGGGQIQLTATGVPFPAANVADLLAGNTYFNLHTAQSPAGEIRGQISPTGNFADLDVPGRFGDDTLSVTPIIGLPIPVLGIDPTAWAG